MKLSTRSKNRLIIITGCVVSFAAGSHRPGALWTLIASYVILGLIIYLVIAVLEEIEKQKA